MESPLVSVLMTAYNREKYICEAIESVLVSTYRNFELIIVDDCSTDRTVEIARSFAERDDRIRLYVNERNLGQFANRNLAVRYANGEYLKYLDSDDLMYPTGLEVLVNMMERFPEAGYGLCSLDQNNARVYPYMLTPAEAYETHFWKQSLFHKAPLSSIIKKSAFWGIGGFSNPGVEGDYEMWLALSSKYNVVLMPAGVVWYRIHEEQADQERRSDPFKQFKYFLVTQKYLANNCPLASEKTKKIAKQTHILMIKYILNTFVRYSPAKAAQMYQAAGYRLDDFLKKTITALVSKIRKN